MCPQSSSTQKPSPCNKLKNTASYTHISNSLKYFFLASEPDSIIKEWKDISIELLKAIVFCHQKNSKRVDRICIKFSSKPIQLWRGGSTPYFKINTKLIFLKKYFNHQVRINKFVNEHSVDNHPSRSGLTSRILPYFF